MTTIASTSSSPSSASAMKNAAGETLIAATDKDGLTSLKILASNSNETAAIGKTTAAMIPTPTSTSNDPSAANNQIMQQQQLQQSYMMQTMMAQAFGGLAGAFGQIFSGLTNAGNSSNKASMMASNDRSNGGCGPNGCPNKDTSQQAWNDNKANPPRNEATNSTNNDQTG